MRSVRLSCGALVLLIAASGCSMFGQGAGEQDGVQGSESATAVRTQRAVVHTVRERETLSSISKKYSGTPTRWRQIVDANPGLKPAKLRPGDELLIPQPLTADPIARDAVAGDAAASGSGKKTSRAAKNSRKGKDSEARSAKSASKRSGTSGGDRTAKSARTPADASTSATARASLQTGTPAKSPAETADRSAYAKTAASAPRSQQARVQTIKGKSAMHGVQLASGERAHEPSSAETLPNHFFVCYRNRCETKIID